MSDLVFFFCVCEMAGFQVHQHCAVAHRKFLR